MKTDFHADFIIIYQWELRPGKEDAFIESWESLMTLYRQLYGAAGARLHRSDDGYWLAYTHWPTRDQYLLAMERGVPDPQLAERMDAAVARRLDPQFLSLASDLLETD